MGCWNETCMLSGLAIRHGDPVVMFPTLAIEEGRTTGTLFPIFGRYDDYGGIEDVENKGSVRWLIQFIRDNKETDKKAAQVKLLREAKAAYYDHISELSRSAASSKRSKAEIEKSAAAMQEKSKRVMEIEKDFCNTFHYEGKLSSIEDLSKLLMGSYSGPAKLRVTLNYGLGDVPTISMGRIFVLRSVWNAVIEQQKKDEGYSDYRNPVTCSAFAEDTIATIRGVLKDKHESTHINKLDFLTSCVSNRIIAAIFAEDGDEKTDLGEITETERGALCSVYKNTAARLITDDLMGSRAELSKYLYTNVIATSAMTEIMDEGNDLMDELLSLFESVFVFRMAMMSLRRNFYSTTGTTSQADEIKATKTLAKTMLAICREREKECEDDENE